MAKHIKPVFFDIINFAVCEAVNEYLDGKAAEFFRKVGEYQLQEVLGRDLIKIESNDRPLEVLVKIANYLENMGYMGKISINKLSENEAFVEMYGVSVTKSSAKMLRKGKQPSHYMTNIMLAALEKLGVKAELEDVSFDEDKCHFKERWKILGSS